MLEPELSDRDLAKAKSCYTQNVQKLLTSDNGKAIDKFVQGKVFNNPNIKKVCKDTNLREQIKQDAMTNIGVVTGMAYKTEVEADCPKYKTALQSFNVSKFN